MVFFKRFDPENIELPVRYTELTNQTRYLVREAYILRQEGLCYYCRGSLHLGPPEDVREKKITPRLYPEGFFDRPIHLHHNHTTDLTIGVVHAYCNAVLWEYHNE